MLNKYPIFKKNGNYSNNTNSSQKKGMGRKKTDPTIYGKKLEIGLIIIPCSIAENAAGSAIILR